VELRQIGDGALVIIYKETYVEGSTMLYCTSITQLVGFYLCGLVTDYYKF
jgi:hypothetical protein